MSWQDNLAFNRWMFKDVMISTMPSQKPTIAFEPLLYTLPVGFHGIILSYQRTSVMGFVIEPEHRGNTLKETVSREGRKTPVDS